MFNQNCRLLDNKKRKLNETSIEEDQSPDEEYVESACYKTKRRCHALADLPVVSSNLELKSDKNQVIKVHVV